MEATVQTEQIQGQKKPSGKKKKWILIVLAIVLAGGFVSLKKMGQRQVAGEVEYQKAAVERRDITNSLTGSGTLQPADSYTVTTLVSGEILSDTFEEGDLVEKDMALYTLDASNVENSLTQARRSYESARKAKYPEATMTGLVTDVYVKNGDVVSNGTQLCRIVGDNNMYIDFLFTYVDQDAFYEGQSVSIYISDFEGSISGVVEQVSVDSTAVSTGRMATTVRVRAENPGLVTAEHTATAVIGNYSSYGRSPVNIGEAAVVTASGNGTVSELRLLPGDSLRAGDRICVLTGDSIDTQLENAQLSLENAQDNLDKYEITAPISGTVVTKNAKAGDKVESGSNSLCTIYDLSYLEMTLNIDELDIAQVAVGQDVQITADAVEDRIYSGVVTRVSVAGTSSGGTTTYPVTVRIDETEGLLPSMNVDAEIFLSSSADVFAIPNGAVNRGNTVLITSDSPSAAKALEQEAPEGYVYVQVITGESDDDYIEIVSGLQEGDTVAYLRTSTGDNMYMMMGGMPGGMPAGGGGMNGGRPGGGFPG